MKPILKVGEMIDCIRSSVQQFNANPHSSICARIGADGEEFEISGLAVKNTIVGPRLIIQLKPK